MVHQTVFVSNIVSLREESQSFKMASTISLKSMMRLHLEDDTCFDKFFGTLINELFKVFELLEGQGRHD